MVHVLVAAHIGYIVAENQEEKKKKNVLEMKNLNTAIVIADV